MGDEDQNTGVKVVGVGSSAGGLEAITKLLSGVRSDAQWCFIIAQHRAPNPDSALVELLSHHTSMTVTTAIDGEPLESGIVYVGPPGCDIVVDDGSIRLPEASPQKRPWPSVDRLLSSLAAEYGPDAVAIILSGTGNDGATGSTAIREGDGIVAVQEPSTAAFTQMPSSTIDAGAVNLIAAPEHIGSQLHDLLFGRPADPPPGSAADDTLDIDTAHLDKIVESLRRTSGVDYSGYKRSTLSRQIERRRRGRNISMDEYVATLSDEPAEASALARAILVSVTSFFRDAPVWESVGPRLKALARSLPDGEPLRLWVPGCATGEEAYTIAMLAADALADSEGSGLSSRLKVFATDLDEAALTVARRGHYRAAAIAAVPQRLRDRWMYHSTAGWAVVPELRECMVIARHNVAYDPPFPRVHLISLRNTLIYFDPRLQARVMDLCHYALVSDGLIVLGLSERISNVDSVFTPVDYVHRIYRRGDSNRLPSIAVTRHLQAPPAHPGTSPNDAPLPTRTGPELAYRRILQITAAPMLILDDHDVLIEVIGDVSAWCTVGEGRQTGAVTEILRDPYKLGVRTLLSRLRQADATTADIVLNEHDPVRITAALVPTQFSARTAVLFRTEETVTTRLDAGSPTESTPVLDMNAQLDSTQRALEAIVADLGASNEELQAMNEELQASSEELQATTEEAQAANEELEATNEELTTLNQELQARTNEALQANTDLTNIQSSLTSGLIIVDRELRVTRFTPLAVRLFSLIDADAGRPLIAIPTTIDIPHLEDDLRATLEQRQSCLREISSATADYMVQTQPYLGANGDVRGVIVVVTDVGRSVPPEGRAMSH